MEYIQKLKNYLVSEDNGYLNSEFSNSKIMMLSGVWGSGKTHFWKESIIKDIKKNIYISLYGKTSLKDIENEVLIKAYYRSLGRESEEKDIVEKVASTFSMLPKTLGTLIGINADEVISKLNDANESSKFQTAKNFMQDGLVICFDDFERKSSNIDLQDLFGFITNLALEFNAKVVVILNSDAFSGEDKEVFTTVKEKSVSKYISFAPSVSELFEIIFKKYEDDLSSHKKVILETLEEVNIVNARIFTQVLDNVVEWVRNKIETDERTIRLLVLVNINFILNHHVYIFDNDKKYTMKGTKTIPQHVYGYISKRTLDENLLENLKLKIEHEEKRNANSGTIDRSKSMLKYIENNQFLILGCHFMWVFEINKYCNEDDLKVSIETFNSVNDFIETGIL